jgi:alkylhydroperoxidase/carboxymuconolactone decarboxylase family protein YurZ
MAKGEAPVLEALADINAVSLERTGLDPASLILVRLAALIAMDAPPASYLAHVGPAVEVGVTLDQAQDVLVAVAPIVGAPRTLAAAAKITEALGLAIDMAETGPPDTSSPIP